MKSINLYRDFFIQWLVLLIAFLIPFMPKFISIIIGLLFVMVIVDGRFFRRLSGIFQNRITLFSALLYLLYLAGILWSDNMKYAGLDLQIKLSLFVFPLLFTGMEKHSNLDVRKISFAFFVGSFIALIICLIRALILFPETGYDGFFYQKLSYFIHPGYFAMYLNYCICFLIHEIVFGEKTSLTWLRQLLFPVTVILIAGLLVLSSKAGIFLLILTLIATIIFVIVGRRPGKILLSLILILTGALLFTVSTPEISKRWNEMSNTISGNEEPTQGHTTGLRLQTWEGAVNLILENPIAGVGTGDAKDALILKYNELNMMESMIMQLNAHNQFLQTTITLGFIGALVLVLLLYFSIQFFMRTRNYLALSFMVIIIFNAMIESILEVQAGVIFFAFFLGIFSLGKRDIPMASTDNC